MDICLPLYLFKMKKDTTARNPEAAENINVFTPKQLQEVEELYKDFLFLIWEFLKWSKNQLKDKTNYKLNLYKKKLCYLEAIIYKQKKYKI